MDRIRKALQKAHAERALEQGPQARLRESPLGRRRAPEESLADVAYRDTPVVEIPESTLADGRLIVSSDDFEALDAYKVLRTRVLHELHAHEWVTVGITSPEPGEGKSLTAANLAISIARTDTNTVLLVDADLRRPSLHKVFGHAPQAGLADCLLRDVPVADCLFNPGIPRLVVLPGREPVRSSSELLRSPRMQSLVEDITTRYPSRIVLFDLPPVLAGDDALTVCPYIDCFLVVLEEGRSRIPAVKKALELLAIAPVLGTVLNGHRPAIGGHYY